MAEEQEAKGKEAQKKEQEARLKALHSRSASKAHRPSSAGIDVPPIEVLCFCLHSCRSKS